MTMSKRSRLSSSVSALKLVSRFWFSLRRKIDANDTSETRNDVVDFCVLLYDMNICIRSGTIRSAFSTIRVGNSNWPGLRKSNSTRAPLSTVALCPHSLERHTEHLLRTGLLITSVIVHLRSKSLITRGKRMTASKTGGGGKCYWHACLCYQDPYYPLIYRLCTKSAK